MVKIFGFALAVFLIVFTVNPVLAQKEVVNFPSAEISIADGFKVISKQAGKNFVVNLSRYNYNQKVKLSKTECTVIEALDQLLAGSGKTYEFSNRHILIVELIEVVQPVVKPEPPVKKVVAPAPSNGYVSGSGNNDEFRRNLYEMERLRAAASREDREVNKVIERNVTDSVFKYPSVSKDVKRTNIDARDHSNIRRLPSVAIKTNLLYLGTQTPNLALELGLGQHSTLDLSGSYNPWNLKGTYDDNKKMVHWIAGAEYRYWTCERFNGHFFGAKLFYSEYNISQTDIPILFEKEFRYQGSAVGAGLSYGYHWMWGKHWGMEFNAGFGVAYMDYVKKDCVKCGSKVGNYNNIYIGPTSLGIKLVYVIK